MVPSWLYPSPTQHSAEHINRLLHCIYLTRESNTNGLTSSILSKHSGSRTLPDSAEVETLLHRLRIRVALTQKYLHTIGCTDIPECLPCSCPGTIGRLLSVCPRYTSGRKLLHLDTCPLLEQKILGSWADTRKQNLAVKALLMYLTNSSQDSRLQVEEKKKKMRLRNSF